jgi:hypothetical protein
MRRNILGIAFAVVGVLATGRLLASSPMSSPSKWQYPYHGKQFSLFVDESFRLADKGSSRSFYNLMSERYLGSPVRLTANRKLSLEQALDSRRAELAALHDNHRKADAEVAIAAQVHSLIKTVIPHFSLERGFEFSNVAARGERQCFLQSVLIAGLLQRMGMNAGVAMVYRNIQGTPTNNGHAVTLLKLPDGKDIIVDASEREAFAKHKGLFVDVRQSGYKYVEPIFQPNSVRIIGYLTTANHKRLSTASVRGLDVAFLRSQFWYYRGERVVGGPLYTPKTESALARSAKAFETSVRLCPSNPLAVCMLGRTYLAEGRIRDAKHLLQKASSLYAQFGWTPAGLKEALASIGARGHFATHPLASHPR